jgi:hypothetical protein
MNFLYENPFAQSEAERLYQTLQQYRSQPQPPLAGQTMRPAASSMVDKGALEWDMVGLLEQQMQPGEIQGLGQVFHRHTLPYQAEKSSQMSVPSVVGMEGMPLPAPRPRGPKLKFTQADDELVVDLKENKHLTWKQIAEFFPGRSSGTLQVRYCTKLKAKTMQWTDEAVSYTHYFQVLY